MKLTGGWSGSSATVSIGSGGARSRAGVANGPASRRRWPEPPRRPAGPIVPARRWRPARTGRAAFTDPVGQMSIRPETSASGSRSATRSSASSRTAQPAVAASRMISMPKPGSTFSILSHSSRVRRFTRGPAAPFRPGSPARGCRPARTADRGAGLRDPASSSGHRFAVSLADVSRDGFRSADRLGEKPLRLDDVWRPDGLDRFAGPAGA